MRAVQRLVGIIPATTRQRVYWSGLACLVAIVLFAACSPSESDSIPVFPKQPTSPQCWSTKAIRPNLAPMLHILWPLPQRRSGFRHLRLPSSELDWFWQHGLHAESKGNWSTAKLVDRALVIAIVTSDIRSQSTGIRP